VDCHPIGQGVAGEGEGLAQRASVFGKGEPDTQFLRLLFDFVQGFIVEHGVDTSWKNSIIRICRMWRIGLRRFWFYPTGFRG